MNDKKLPDDSSRLNNAFERALARTPYKREEKVYLAILKQLVIDFKRSPDDVKKLLQINTLDEGNYQLAAWTAVAQVILNLDETMNKQ